MSTAWNQLVTSEPSVSHVSRSEISFEIERPRVKDKFLYLGNEKFYVRGVTYGPFEPEPDGCEYHTPDQVEEDFAGMRRRGVNTVRTYTVPPRWLLDLAEKYGLYLMIGLPWEQHVAFLEKEGLVKTIKHRVREGVRSCREHPAVLCYTIGNEIPPSIVRWYGRERISGFLHRLYRIVKHEDPHALVTYVNFPTTEYLHLPFLDFFSFNVYLEHQEELERYLSHLQHLAGDRPLLLAEVGLDSRSNGVEQQARTLNWQIRTIFTGGAAGAVVFAWTDEWYRGGHEITDWDFGLTTRDRSPKPALETVGEAFQEVPAAPDELWPSVSVIICSYDGASTMTETLEHVIQLDYPEYEVIVVDDGSIDRTAEIARRYPVQVIRTENRGLSSARNTGLDAATGEIVAYLDDDAYPDPDWLTYLAATFRRHDYVGVGGPNIPPPGDGFLAECIGRSPGGPSHVLISEEEAEHIPGCNMAFRRKSLEEIGGFDDRFRIAGDDVDLCWRLQEAGGRLGFHPSALVWHHPRSSISGFWKQQSNYGRAEAMLEVKWPSKYNLLGHSKWAGRVYANGDYGAPLWRRWRVYYGQWGRALFQPLYAPPEGILGSLPQLPEWYLIVSLLGVLSALGIFLDGLTYIFPAFLIALAIPLLQAGKYAVRKVSAGHAKEGWSQISRIIVIGFVYCMQPMARLWGRIEQGLSPWRRFEGNPRLFTIPRSQQLSVWSEDWVSRENRLETMERTLEQNRVFVTRGGAFDRWDIEVQGGIFGGARMLMAIEEHGEGRQMVRIKSWPRLSSIGSTFLGISGISAGLLGLYGYWPATLVMLGLTVLVGAGIIRDCGTATAAYGSAVHHLEGEPVT